MIDSHCHLDHEPIFENLNDIIIRSKKVGIEKLLTICTTLEGYKNILNIIQKDPIIYGTFGIHPHETKNQLIGKEEIIKQAKLNKKIIGIGESGLDFYYNNSDKDSQIKSFNSHIDAAIELEFPLIVHSRNAENETFEILKKKNTKNLKILMHCFTGSSNFAKNLIKLDAYFSASGIITFKNSNELQETFKIIPNEKLLIETDSPFLAPVPMRGKKNEPSFIKFTLEKLSELKNIEIKQLDRIITDNFNKLFFK
tara:strand:+ start:578 stop:1339 length:762 start_codon:yes stop_codon:yes gene_type:complete